LVAPPVIRLLRHAELAANTSKICSVGKHLVGLPEFTNDLLRGVSFPVLRHDVIILPARQRGCQDNSHNART